MLLELEFDGAKDKEEDGILVVVSFFLYFVVVFVLSTVRIHFTIHTHIVYILLPMSSDFIEFGVHIRITVNPYRLSFHNSSILVGI